jgi:serine/threonine protein kinase
MVSSVSVGMVVAGRYTLERCLNTGGIGSLWLARDEQNDTSCGLRLAESSGQGIVELATRYLAEVDVVGRIRCENIVDILDYGEWNGMPFLVLEHVEGEDLSATLIHKGFMQPKAAYRIIAQTARALARAHAAGIVHGDLTPEHILITSDGMQPMAKVFNFGLSQRAGEAGGTKTTRIGSFLRMPYYSSPEHVTGKDADWRSDLWSLAVISHECLVGKKPFDSSAFGELVARIMSESVPPILLPGGRTPAALQTWWEKATARDPANRFQSAKEISDALGKAFGFPLVFVPEAAASSAAPHASPASLPIVLRDSSVPPPVQEPGRARTPNPNLKPAPGSASGKPPQVTVRSNSPAPEIVINKPVTKYTRQSTQMGVGPEGRADFNSSYSPRTDTKPGLAIPRPSTEVKTSSDSSPPSSLKIDVDIDIPSADFSPSSKQAKPASANGERAKQTRNDSNSQSAAALEEEIFEGFPLSEAPTMARKTAAAKSAAPVVREVKSIEPPNLAQAEPRRSRHGAAWATAAAIVVLGSAAAVYVLRFNKKLPRPTASASTSAPAMSSAPAPSGSIQAGDVTSASNDALVASQDAKPASDSTPDAGARRATAESKASKSESQARLRPTERATRDKEKPVEKGARTEKGHSSNQPPTTPMPVEPNSPTPASSSKAPPPASSVTSKPSKPKAPAPAGNDYGI